MVSSLHQLPLVAGSKGLVSPVESLTYPLYHEVPITGQPWAKAPLSTEMDNTSGTQ